MIRGNVLFKYTPATKRPKTRVLHTVWNPNRHARVSATAWQCTHPPHSIDRLTYIHAYRPKRTPDYHHLLGTWGRADNKMRIQTDGKRRETSPWLSPPRSSPLGRRGPIALLGLAVCVCRGRPVLGAVLLLVPVLLFFYGWWARPIADGRRGHVQKSENENDAFSWRYTPVEAVEDRAE